MAHLDHLPWNPYSVKTYDFWCPPNTWVKTESTVVAAAWAYIVGCDDRPNTLLTKMLGLKGLGVFSSGREGNGGGCDEDTKTRELSVVQWELNPTFSSEHCQKWSSETADKGTLVLSAGDSRLLKGGWTWRVSPVVNPDIREGRADFMEWSEDEGMLTWIGIRYVLECTDCGSVMFYLSYPMHPHCCYSRNGMTSTSNWAPLCCST